MLSSDLATYLKDHDAGSEAALQILDHLEKQYGSGPVGDMARTLRPQFLSERSQVHRLLTSMDDSFSAPRRLFGWLSEKALQLKLMADDPDNGPLRLLETVELLGLGVHGKRGMWKALEANKDCVSVLESVPFAALIAQAEAQEQIIESVRLSAAKDVIL